MRGSFTRDSWTILRVVWDVFQGICAMLIPSVILMFDVGIKKEKRMVNWQNDPAIKLWFNALFPPYL